MRSIAILNQKGGVGKTTTTVNLGAGLAELGQRVCVVDLDPQAHASLHLGLAPSGGADSIYAALVGNTPIADLRHQVGQRLWTVPSHLDLAALEIELAGEARRELVLRDRLARDDARFDFLLIDCPPSLGLLTLNALAAADEIYLPLQPHFLALHGLSKLLRTIELVARRFNGRLRLSGVILCMYESGTRLAAEVARDVEEFFAREQDPSCPWSGVRVFQTRVRRNIRLAEAPSFGQSIFQYAAASNGAEDYRRLAREVLGVSGDEAAPRRRDHHLPVGGS